MHTFPRLTSYMRSMLKAITWRAVASVDTILLAWLITGNLRMASSIATLEVFTKIAIYYFHERVWVWIKLGQSGRKEKINADAY